MNHPGDEKKRVSSMRMMKRRNVVLGVCFSCLIFLSGCASVPPTHYYTFQPLDAQAPSSISSHYPFILAIDKFLADPQYQQDRIVYRTSPYEINFYEYRRWIKSPDEIVTERVLNIVKAQALFQDVHTGVFESYSDYILQGKITMFDQWYSQKSSTVRIRIQYQLFATQSEQIVWNETIDTSRESSGTEIVAIVMEFETALQENILRALSAIDAVLERRQSS